MKKINIPIIISIVAVLALAGGAWSSRQLEDSGGNPVIARNGLHRHATLSIVVDGVKQDLPQNIGLAGAHQPIHTHDPDNVVHLEMSGMVRQNDLMLREFFRVWGRSMESFGTLERMTVNGTESTTYGAYVMEDGDAIELEFISAGDTPHE